MAYTSETALDAAPMPGVSPLHAMRRFAGRAFHLNGRASRSEYWWWMLANTVVLAITQLLVPALISGRAPHSTLLFGPFGSAFFANIQLFNWDAADAPSSPLAAFSLVVAGIWLIVTIIPGFTVAVRRLHDSNLSGWWVLLVFVPFGTSILLLLATRRPRTEGARFDV